MVSRVHTDGDVFDSVIDALLSIRQSFVAEDDLAIPFVRQEVIGSVLSNKPAKALAHIQQPKLCP